VACTAVVSPSAALTGKTSPEARMPKASVIAKNKLKTLLGLLNVFLILISFKIIINSPKACPLTLFGFPFINRTFVNDRFWDIYENIRSIYVQYLQFTIVFVNIGC
jgi:hypothetical protein